MFRRLGLALAKRRLREPRFSCLFDRWDGTEVVSVDCETTSLDARSCDLVALVAIKVRDNRILCSQRLELLIRPADQDISESAKFHMIRDSDRRRGVSPEEAIFQFVEFVGPRPLIGYYLEFDVAVLDKYLRPLAGIGLPNLQIDVSGLYFQREAKRFYERSPGQEIDLSFRALCESLGVPHRMAHDPVSDATLAALMYLKLQEAKT